MTRACFVVGAIGLLFPTLGLAQTRIDYSQGPILNSNRIIGMSGAFVSVAEGADAHLVNPASFAMRARHVRNDFFDWDWSLYFLSDFVSDDGSRPEASTPEGLVDGTTFGGVGLDCRTGVMGFGAHGYSKEYHIQMGTYSDTGELLEASYQVTQSIVTLGVGMAAPWIETTFGLAILGGSFRIEGATLGPVLELNGVGVNVGGVWHPQGKPYRVGLAMNAPVQVADVEELPPTEIGFDVESMAVPGRITVGGSWMFGPRVYNPAQTWGMEMFNSYGPGPGERRYVLVSGDLALDMPTQNTVAAASVFRGPPEVSGQSATLSPRLGAESEFWPDRMRARSGLYYEPSRVQRASGRLHWTAGVDVRMRLGWDWNVNAVMAVAREYRNVGLGLSFWH